MKTIHWIMLLAVGAAVGCTEQQLEKARNDWNTAFGLEKTAPGPDANAKTSKIKLPPDVKGTIAQDVTLQATGSRPVSGVGLCVGLVDKGSEEIPPSLRTGLVNYLKKRRFGSFSAGTAGVTPTDVLRDRDTAIVVLHAPVPLGAPKGTRLDVFVEVAPRTSAISLEGGLLWQTDLAIGGASTGGIMGATKLTWLAKAEGSVFLNPFIDA
ncbi:MAG: hypothetical protein HN909_01355, partial [Phycisphaerales bacterium]|nr:hypothetical protein [Phycisphaerales bacterium]